MTGPGHTRLDEAGAGQLASVALGHVRLEYPHGLSHVFSGPEPVAAPRQLHPIFYGSFDWHSCVHGYWMLATLLRRFPHLSCGPVIRDLFDGAFTEAAVEAECAYFRRPTARGFERPYGWGWVLALQQTLGGTAWDGPLRPLSDLVAARFRDYLAVARYPVRVGTHFNSAFAMTVSAAYAAAHDGALLAAMRDSAGQWYGHDAACQAWEPSQDDFLSSALIEAVCMQRLLPADRFVRWFDGFLPDIAAGRPATLFQPAVVTDRTDGKIAHLDGLNLSRSWCWREIAQALPPADPRRDIALRSAASHHDASIAHVTGDFMGEHWLATFAVLATLDDAL